MTRRRIFLILLTVLLTQLVLPSVLRGTDPIMASAPGDVDQAVVKIMSKTNGPGTGVVVCVDGDTASIVTAAHVVEGDEVVQVSISPRADITYQAHVNRIDN